MNIRKLNESFSKLSIKEGFDVQQKLEKELVHKRFTKEELKSKLEEIMGEPMELCNTPKDGLTPEQDYAFDIGGKESGFGTIFYTKTRAGKVYVTEVEYEEEDV